MSYLDYNPRFFAEKVCHNLGICENHYINLLHHTILWMEATGISVIDTLEVFEWYVKNSCPFLIALGQAIYEVSGLKFHSKTNA